MNLITQMVDLKGQYQRLQSEIDAAVSATISSTRYIGGPEVTGFATALEDYLGVKHVIPCANGTDALQIAMMAFDLEPGDEVIVPAFTYVATAEVIALLRLTPVMVDVDPKTFNVDVEAIEKAITPKTKAIVPVHLFGQSADMEPIMQIAEAHSLFVIEDAAQSVGSKYTFNNGQQRTTGTIGHIGTTSFFPSKNLGCYGDGGAIYTNDDQLAAKIKMVANHGQSKRYYHDIIGVNSRLDAIQAAVLNVKLKYLDEFTTARQAVAKGYDDAFAEIENITTPFRASNADHVFHQYTMIVDSERRDELKSYLADNGVPAMIYYPVPLYKQKAFSEFYNSDKNLAVTEKLCQSVISLPIHTEFTPKIHDYITEQVTGFYQPALKS
ncbi:MAG: DegT/DnrJ/EryC1/StrS family aminotransferase [Bacteroidota bacterium]